ncbi:hypothetical protein [Kitasatospora sp. NPDC057936]|uniref:hypothetical protein n=1 Tax=Kitasatospora sp. NPDC057936 TaxID=3346283 RepID=UPI0036DF136C
MGWSMWNDVGIAETISPPAAARILDDPVNVTCFTVHSSGNVFATPVNPYPFTPGNVPPPLVGQVISGYVGPPKNAVVSPRSPGAILDHDGNVNFFAIGTDSYLRLNENDAHGWQSLGGVWTHGVSALSRAGLLECFTVGTDSSLYHRPAKTKPGGAPTWDDWDQIESQLTSAPSAISTGPGRNDVFALGLNGMVEHAYWRSGHDWHWESPKLSQDEFIHGPAVASSAVDQLDLFTVRTDSGIDHRWFDGKSWSSPEDLGGPPPLGVTITSPATIAFDGPEANQVTLVLFAVGTDSHVYFKTWTNR